MLHRLAKENPGHCWSGLGVWWTEGGSNSRPPHCERGALPAELSARETRDYSRCFGVWEGGVEQRMTQRAQRDWRECGGRRCAKQRFARRSRKPRQRRRGVVETSPSSPRRRPTGDFRERQQSDALFAFLPPTSRLKAGVAPLGAESDRREAAGANVGGEGVQSNALRAVAGSRPKRAATWTYYSANTCFTRSVSSRSMMPKRRSMFGCLPGWARAWSVCSAKSSSPLRAASGVMAP